MIKKKLVIAIIAALIVCALPLTAADKKKSDASSAETSRPSYELPQPAKEDINYSMYHQKGFHEKVP